jgi:osmotically-inducible protein OsmY
VGIFISTKGNQLSNMKERLLAAYFLAVGLVAPLGVAAQTAPEDRSSPPRVAVSSPAITAQVQAELARDAHVVAKDIKVQTDSNGVVTLTGAAKTQQELDRATFIARSVRGVVSVDNRIQLSSER